MDQLRVRAYNVHFGDALLVTVPDRAPNGQTTPRHILVDVGNVLWGEGGSDDLFQIVIEDILDVLDGAPVDLYVMTHEHLDHVQGLPYAAQELGLEIPVRHAWLTASAAPDYGERHPEAQALRQEAQAVYHRIAAYLAAKPEATTPWIQALMRNNNPRRTADCVAYLRELADETTYVHRGVDLAGRHPFQEAAFDILAPEADIATYYGYFHPMALGLAGGSAPQADPRLIRWIPPEGVDAGAFYNLVDARRQSFAENLLAINRVSNNTSVVWQLRWRGWTLLFPGDAQTRSWRTMHKHGVLEPVQFLKVSHHGSHNGTPGDEILDQILPLPAPDARKRIAVISTHEGIYNLVPDEATIQRLAERAETRSVEGLPPGAGLDVIFPAPSPAIHRGVAPTSEREPLSVRIPQVHMTRTRGESEMTEDVLHICVDRRLPPDRIIDAAERAVERNPANTPVFRAGFGVVPPSRLELAAVTGKLWRPGHTLRVAFMDGAFEVQSKVEAIAQTWTQFANVQLEFSDAPTAELRVSFNQRGSWSYIGTDALAVARNEPTINFGWLTPNSSDDECERVVLHEFGHALGCIHEHQSPVAGIPWDREAVYAYYAGPPNFWTRAEVDLNIFAKYDRTITQFSDFDPDSIMLYPIEESLTIGDYAVGWNRDLSTTDKRFISVLYPQDLSPAKAVIVDGPAVEASIGIHGEEDMFRFEVVNRGRYLIETRGWTDVTMALLGPDNQSTVLAEDDDSGSRLNAKIERELGPGTYYVRIRHYRPTGTGNYELAVSSA